MSPSTSSVVVGVDGSQNALDAVAWAAREAALRHRTLRVVHAYVWPLIRIPRMAAGFASAPELRKQAQAVLDEGAQTAAQVAPTVKIVTCMETDFPLPLLESESRSASLVVVGSHGLLAGGTVASLVAHAHAPVAVVRDNASAEEVRDQVLVGVDGSELGGAAVGVAFDYAAWHRCGLLAVHVLHGDHDPAEGELILGEAPAGWQEKYPEVEIRRRLVTGHAAGSLVHLSRGALATVVGSRGRGGFTGLLLGSVSQSLVHHANSPVIVVPHGHLGAAR